MRKQFAGLGGIILAAIAPVIAFAQPTGTTTRLDPVVVTATRNARPASQTAHAVDVLSAENFRNSPARTVDDVLRASAAFSLFRRSSSLYANPTAQGVSLRGIGPSGASRTLVLLDGVPLNDPFGGWVSWSKIPRESLIGAEIVRGGGSGAWGNAALGGVVQLFTAPARAESTGSVALEAGAFNTWSAEIAATGQNLHVAGKTFHTDGFFTLAPEDRGTVDQPLSSEHDLWQASWQHAVSATTTLTVTGRWFEEERNNGTALQRNASREAFGSVALSGQPRTDLDWTASLHFQQQNFDSFFSAVNASRSAETPANHQFDVPSQAAGAALSGTWRTAQTTTTAGADFRWVEGQTTEDFFFNGGAFSRRRAAGGEQAFAGVFINHDRALEQRWRLNAGLRVDAWENRDGFRRETDRASGAVLRDDRFQADDGVEVSPHVGLVWTPDSSWRARASAYRAFRVPTLNEFHRPFRVGIITTEANAALRPESLEGAEIGLEFGNERMRAGVTVFANRLNDAVSNVTLARTPGAISRQRRNLERIEVSGFEFKGEWRPLASMRASVDWLWNDARVERAGSQPNLEGRRLAQVPRHVISAGLEWDARDGVLIGLRARHVSEQFEDDENAFALASATTLDAMARWEFRASLAFFVAVENLFDETVETGRSNEGIVSLGAPRLARGGVRFTW